MERELVSIFCISETKRDFDQVYIVESFYHIQKSCGTPTSGNGQQLKEKKNAKVQFLLKSASVTGEKF